jgi:hypothetical protein
LQRFAELTRRAIVAFAVTTLIAAALWGLYQIADDEWTPASFRGRDYNCGSPTSDPELAPVRRLPGKMNGNPVYVVAGWQPELVDEDPTLVQVRVGDRYRLCGLSGGP